MTLTEDQLVTPVSLDIARATIEERWPELQIKSLTYLGGGSFSVLGLAQLS